MFVYTPFVLMFGILILCRIHVVVVGKKIFVFAHHQPTSIRRNEEKCLFLLKQKNLVVGICRHPVNSTEQQQEHTPCVHCVFVFLFLL